MIARKTFIKIMDALKESNESADRMDDLINPIIKERMTVNGNICFSEMFCDWKMQDIILDALSEELNDEKDEYGYTWIGYFAYELDWGKKWHYGCIKDCNGDDIKMQTAGDLYDYLTKSLTADEIKKMCEKCGQA